MRIAKIGSSSNAAWGRLAAISANVLNMVGVGPFLTIPLAISAMGGPQAMVGWLLGALLCLCDGMVWAELGSAMPSSGRFLLLPSARRSAETALASL